MKKKFYVVWEGRKPGIYLTWDDCKEQVHGFDKAKYKAFENRQQAELAFKKSYWEVVGKQAAQTPAPASNASIIWDSLTVDAACSGNPGDMEYQAVWTKNGQKAFHQGPFPGGTNNIGEFLALVHALAFLKKEGKPQLPIYSDSRNAQIWIRAKKCKTKLEPNSQNNKVFELIDRAEKWLAMNSVTNPILKWETDKWGENPADFGRK